MRILFNSKKEEFKSPFGCLTAGECCTLRVHVPETVGATHVVCLLQRDGGETTEVTMPKTDAKGVYDIFSADFRLEKTGLYFYFSVCLSPAAASVCSNRATTPIWKQVTFGS